MALFFQTIIFEEGFTPGTPVSAFPSVTNPVGYVVGAGSGRRYYQIDETQPFALVPPQPITAGAIILPGPEMNDKLVNDDQEPEIGFGVEFRDMYVVDVDAFECGGRSRIAVTLGSDNAGTLGKIKSRWLRIRAFEEMRLIYDQADTMGTHKAMRPYVVIDQDNLKPEDREFIDSSPESYLNTLVGTGNNPPIQMLGQTTVPGAGVPPVVAKIIPHKVQGRSLIVVVSANTLSDANQHTVGLP